MKKLSMRSAVFCLLCLSSALGARPAVLDIVDKGKRPFDDGDGLVGFICTKSPEARTSPGRCTAPMQDVGASSIKDLTELQMKTFKAKSIQAVEARLDVLGECCEVLEVDAEVKAIATCPNSVGSTWGLDYIDGEGSDINDDLYRPNGDGSNAVVYVLDTGVLESHNEFTGRISVRTPATHLPLHPRCAHHRLLHPPPSFSPESPAR